MLKQKDLTLKAYHKRIARAKRIEEACRKLCLQNGIDPEMLICKQAPAYLNYPIPAYIVPDPMHTMKAWWIYREVVEEALHILKK